MFRGLLPPPSNFVFFVLFRIGKRIQIITKNNHCHGTFIILLLFVVANMNKDNENSSDVAGDFASSSPTNRELSELSMSSLDNNAAMEVLTKMMRDQALLAQSLTANQQHQQHQQLHEHNDVARLSCEKDPLAAQVMALQQQLAMSQAGYMPTPPPPPRPIMMTMNPRSPPYGNFPSSASVESHRSAHSHRSYRSHNSHHMASNHRSHGFEQPYPMTMTTMSPAQPSLMLPLPYPGIISAPCIPMDDMDGRSISSVHSSFSGRSRSSHRSSLSKSSHRSTSSSKSSKKKRSKKEKKRAQNGGFDPPLEEYVRPEHPSGSKFWKGFSGWMTCLVPDACIPREGATVKQAWREKVTICITALALSAFVVGGIGFLPIYFCRSSTKYTSTELQKRDESWTSLYGRIYIFDKTFRHPGGNEGTVDRYIKKDASPLFPRPPLTAMPSFCLNMNKSEYIAQFNQPTCELTEEDVLEGAYCHDSIVGVQTSYAKFEPWLDGQVVIPRWELEEEKEMQFVLINNQIYNVTQYINALRDPQTNRLDKDPNHPNAYLSESLHLTIVNKVNQDATQVFYDVFKNDDYLFCLNELFFEAYLDDRFDPLCQSIGVFMYFFLFFVVGMLTIQVGRWKPFDTFCLRLYSD